MMVLKSLLCAFIIFLVLAEPVSMSCLARALRLAGDILACFFFSDELLMCAYFIYFFSIASTFLSFSFVGVYVL